MNIIQTFLNLTSKTYPHGTEHLLEEFLPKDISKDIYDNYFIEIGDSPRVIFASHLDTVSATYDDVVHTFTESGKIVGTDGNTTLGADDKAGVTIMLNMIENKVPGLYYFFVGEEVGCIGSGKVSREVKIFNKEKYDKVISFDRRGNTSVITHQSAMRCCSEKFAEALCTQLNAQGLGMETDNGGVCTDSLEFIDEIPECTNISVGYLDEHTGDETQDLEFLERISEACVHVDWEGLPTERDPSVTEYKHSRRGPNRHNNLNSDSWNRNTIHYDEDLMSERERYALVCGYYEDIYGENEDYGSDGFTINFDEENDDMVSSEFGPVDLWEQFENNNVPNIREDHDHCYYPKNLYPHRERFFDNIGNTEYQKEKKRYFDSLKDKYMDDRMTDEEVEIIKEQLLDMDDPIDAAFAEEIDSLVNLKNWCGSQGY